jgi:hypothetical protein
MPNFLSLFYSRLLYIRDLRIIPFSSSNKNSLNWEKHNQHDEKHSVLSAPLTNMTKPIINYDQVLALSNQNIALAKKLLEAFLHELEPVVKTFRASPTDEDMVAISKLSHKIKPSLQLLDLEILNQKMNVYKMKCREGTTTSRSELPALYQEIIKLYKQIEEEIRIYINGMQE